MRHTFRDFLIFKTSSNTSGDLMPEKCFPRTFALPIFLLHESNINLYTKESYTIKYTQILIKYHQNVKIQGSAT